MIQFNLKMIRSISQISFKMSFQRSILVLDPAPIDILPHDIPARSLHEDVTTLLQIPYLSKYAGSKQELLRKSTYKGAIIGNLTRLFFSIPTARKHSQQYYNVHYLLDTSSTHTTLTHQALCCLYGKNIDDPNVVFPPLLNTLIGGMTVQTRLSNPNSTEKNSTPYYQNANRLGMNFLRKFKEFNLKVEINKSETFLELIR